MNAFITFRDKDKEGILQYYILQRNFPHYVGIITMGPIEGNICSIPVSGYNMWVNFSGTILGNLIPSYKDAMKELVQVYVDMADWFYKNRVLENIKKYDKFKIKNNVTIPG